MRIMLVDDESVVLEGLKAIIDRRKTGWEIAAAVTSGEEAIAALPMTQPDIVVTDIRMYEVSGLDLAAYVRQHNPDTLVVLLTGHADFSYAQQAISLGAFEYILKPSRYADIIACLERAETAIEKRNRIRQEGQRLRTHLPSDWLNLQEALLKNLALGQTKMGDDIDTELERLSLDGKDYGVLHCMLAPAYQQHENPLKARGEGSFLSRLKEAFQTAALYEGDTAASLIFAFDNGAQWNKTQLLEKLNQVDYPSERAAGMRLFSGWGSLKKHAEELFDSRSEAIYAAEQAVKNASPLVFFEDIPVLENQGGMPAIAAAMRYIDENYQNALTLEDISKAVYLNPCYLSTLFKEDRGMTLTEYTQKKRIDEAKRLMTNTSLKLSIIASRVGIPDHSYFSALFKKITGMTPSQYRGQQPGNT